MIQYYNPNLYVSSIIKSLFNKNAEQKIIKYFQAYSKKKYILITGSCRSALYLTYKSLDKKKRVITSPLTCYSAIQPILLSDKKIDFIDISENSLNMDIKLITDKLLEDNDIIQIIHHGGVPLNYSSILGRLKENNIFIIEDCAQAFGSFYNNKNVGSEADVACYSLIKNLYGIGGGILATDNEELYEKAKELQNTLPLIGLKLIVFRIIRNILESYRRFRAINFLFGLLMDIRPKKNESYNLKLDENTYVKPSKLLYNINLTQLKKSLFWIQKNKNIANIMLEKLRAGNVIYNDSFDNNCSFTKFFIYNPKFNSKKTIKKLIESGIEAKHLEQKFGSSYQERFDNIALLKNNKSLYNCERYFKVHDSIISLPIKNNYNLMDFINV